MGAQDKLLGINYTFNSYLLELCPAEMSFLRSGADLRDGISETEALSLGGAPYIMFGKPRAFMTPPKNPLVYERLYV